MKPTVMLLHEYKGETNTDPLPLLKKRTLSSNLQKRISHQQTPCTLPTNSSLTYEEHPKSNQKRKKKKAGHLVQNLYDLHGERQLFKPISLCFLDGPEAGIGILLGKNPKKWPED